MSPSRRFLTSSSVLDEAYLAAALPLAGVVLSEYLVFTGRTRAALGGHLITILICTLGPIWLRDELSVFQAFALIPVFRLVGLSMPAFVTLTILWLPLVYGPFLPAGFLIARSNRMIELRGGWLAAIASFPLVVVCGAVLAEVEYGIIRPEPLVSSASLPNFALLVLVMVGFVAVVEELLFRGILQQTLQAQLGTWPGIVLAAGVFAAMHAGYGLAEEVGLAFSLGLLFGIIYHLSDSLVTVTLFHGVLNIFLFGVIPLYGPVLPLI